MSVNKHSMCCRPKCGERQHDVCCWDGMTVEEANNKYNMKNREEIKERALIRMVIMWKDG